MTKIKVMACDDAEYYLNYLEDVIKTSNDIVCVKTVMSAQECAACLPDTEVDVLLLDIQMENPSAGIDVLPVLLSIKPDIKIIILSGFDYEENIFAAFVAGAVDFLPKETKPDEILEAIRSAYNNKPVIKAEIAAKLVGGAQKFNSDTVSMLYYVQCMAKLSKAEFELLKQVYNGVSYADISKQRYVEQQSVRMMASRVLKKFNVSNMELLIENLKKLNIFKLYKD